jgi:hypothetical protein
MTGTPSERQVPSPIEFGQVRRKLDAKPGCEEHEPHKGDPSLREEAWYCERECHPEARGVFAAQSGEGLVPYPGRASGKKRPGEVSRGHSSDGVAKGRTGGVDVGTPSSGMKEAQE